MSDPKISIVTVCFNAVDTIEETILSVINQTYPNIEYIIIDGKSTDGTLDVINNYRDKFAYFISEPDNGIYDAMNKSLDIASGDFLLFLGADDVLYSHNTIEIVARNCLSRNCVYYGNVIFKPSGKIYKGKFNNIKWAIINICHQAIFYPKEIYNNYKYKLKYKVYADYEYNLRLLSNRIVFRYLDVIVTIYDSSGFSSKTDDIAFEEDRLKLVKNAVGWIPMFCGVMYRKYIDIFVAKNTAYDRCLNGDI